jgi:hypothetical protein
LRDILLAGYAISHPNSEINPDGQVPYLLQGRLIKMFEEQRRKIIGLERHVLETMTFDFRAHHPQPYIIKFTKYLKRTPPEKAQTKGSPPGNSPTSMAHSPRRLPHFRPAKIPAPHPRPSLHPPLFPPPKPSPPPTLHHPRLQTARGKRRYNRLARPLHPPSHDHAHWPAIRAPKVYGPADFDSAEFGGDGGG